MSKQTDDLIDQISGVCVGLSGLKVQLTAIPAQYPTEPGAPTIPPKEVTQEDWAHAKKLAESLKALAGDLEAQISRESKVPEDPSKSKSKASA